MTEKRFKVEKEIFDGYCIVDSNDEGYYAYEKHDLERLCDSLNKLVTKYHDLEKENEKLKSELENCRECLELNRESCARHMKENEQLKSKNLILKDKLHQLRLKCGKQEEEIECLSEETIEKFKQDLQDGNFIEFTAR